jgi:hypothetical protein
MAKDEKSAKWFVWLGGLWWLFGVASFGGTGYQCWLSSSPTQAFSLALSYFASGCISASKLNVCADAASPKRKGATRTAESRHRSAAETYACSVSSAIFSVEKSAARFRACS